MDINKLSKEFDSILASIDESEFKEWCAFDNAQVLLEKLYNGELIEAGSSFVMPSSIEISGSKTLNELTTLGEINYNLAA